MAPTPTFTPRESELLVAAFLSHRNPWDIDYSKMAELSNFKNGKSACDCFRGLRKKIEACKEDDDIDGEEDDAGAAPAKKATAAPKKRKTAVKNDGEADVDAGATASPKKKAARGKGGKKSQKVLVVEEEEEDDDVDDDAEDETLGGAVPKTEPVD